MSERPQEKMEPLAMRTSMWLHPQAICSAQARASPKSTHRGDEMGRELPALSTPHCPRLLSPQVNTWPLWVRAAENCQPQRMDTGVCVEGHSTRLGVLHRTVSTASPTPSCPCALAPVA